MQGAARVAKLLSDETRLLILEALGENEATVSDLVARLGLPQPRISTHLAALRAGGLIEVSTDGRQRTYRVDLERIAPILTALHVLAPADPGRPEPSRQAAREVARDSPIRQARTCYDHLAGVAGVRLLDELLRREWLTAQRNGSGRHSYQLTPRGAAALAERGVKLPSADRARRLFAFGCLDWTERRSHLGGALGVAIFRSLESRGAAQRAAGSRVVRLAAPIDAWLGETAQASTPRGAV